jgi:hypothetical protein
LRTTNFCLRLLQLGLAQFDNRAKAGVDAHNNSRISAGGLNNPIIFPRAAGGVMVSQLITD